MITARYLLDTDIVSDVLRHPAGKVAQQIRKAGPDAVSISIVTAAELRFGAAKRGSPRLSQLVDRLLDELTILPFDAPADNDYADIRHALERAGKPIGPNDLLIAAHARSRGMMLVTANMREFARVPGLQVINWLE